MTLAVQRLGQRITSAGPGATGLFYFAGHGAQSAGKSYLIPVDAQLQTEADLEVDAVVADAALLQMRDASARTSILVLDACLNLPLRSSTRDATRGLARVNAPNGSFVAYSTAPGDVALDGTGANSPFSRAFATEIANKGQPIEITFRNVRRSVAEATANRQTPWDSSSLFDSFVFTP